jgi:hypothetical protein
MLLTGFLEIVPSPHKSSVVDPYLQISLKNDGHPIPATYKVFIRELVNFQNLISGWRKYLNARLSA